MGQAKRNPLGHLQSGHETLSQVCLYIMVISSIRQKLKVMQNTALRTGTICHRDTNIEHLDDETQILPLTEHSKLHASQIKQKAQHPCHPLQKLTKQNRTLDTKTYEANHFQQHKLHNTPKHSDHGKHFIKQKKFIQPLAVCDRIT